MKVKIKGYLMSSKPGMVYAKVETDNDVLMVAALENCIAEVVKSKHEIVNGHEFLIWLDNNCRIVANKQ